MDSLMRLCEVDEGTLNGLEVKRQVDLIESNSVGSQTDIRWKGLGVWIQIRLDWDGAITTWETGPVLWREIMTWVAIVARTSWSKIWYNEQIMHLPMSLWGNRITVIQLRRWSSYFLLKGQWGTLVCRRFAFLNSGLRFHSGWPARSNSELHIHSGRSALLNFGLLFHSIWPARSNSGLCFHSGAYSLMSRRSWAILWASETAELARYWDAQIRQEGFGDKCSPE